MYSISLSFSIVLFPGINTIGYNYNLLPEIGTIVLRGPLRLLDTFGAKIKEKETPLLFHVSPKNKTIKVQSVQRESIHLHQSQVLKSHGGYFLSGPP